MASIQKIFFQPQRGFREFTWNEKTNDVDPDDEGTLWELDGVMQERHRNVISLTKQPVEYGAAITDHSFRQPIIINVQGIITNSPSLKQLGNNIPNFDGNNGVFTQVAQSFTGERIQSAYAGLMKLQNKRLPMRLQTGLLNYENMVLTDVQVPNNKNNRLLLDMTFEEAIIIKPDSDSNEAQIVLASDTNEIDYFTAVAALAGIGVAGLAGLIIS